MSTDETKKNTRKVSVGDVLVRKAWVDENAYPVTVVEVHQDFFDVSGKVDPFVWDDTDEECDEATSRHWLNDWGTVDDNASFELFGSVEEFALSEERSRLICAIGDRVNNGGRDEEMLDKVPLASLREVARLLCIEGVAAGEEIA